MPKPPPPPPGPPPPPAFPVGITSAPAPSRKNGSADNRNQLLTDIRHGAKLKKAVTNDRSAPVIEGASKSSGGKPSVANGGPPGLAGLFAGGMPALKPSGFNQRQQALLPPAKKAFTDDAYKPPGKPQFGSQSNPSSPQPTAKSGIPAGYGTMRGFPKDLKGLAPQPPPACQKPLASSSIGPGDNGRVRPGPPLPNKPPNVPNARPNLAPFVPRAPPSNKPPPPPKSPAVMSGPPALPSKPPNRPRPQSVNESDYRHNGRPVVQKNACQASPAKERPPSIQEDQSNRMKNASTPNLHQLQNSGVTKPLPPPPPPRAEPPFPQFNSLPFKLNQNGQPMQNRPAPVKAPATRPPPPPPTGPPRVLVGQPSVPPPPPPHRSNPPLQPPPPQFKPGFNNTPNNAPPPPPRNSSTKNLSGEARYDLMLHSPSSGRVPSNSMKRHELDGRFYHMFLSTNSLPWPEPFTNCMKSYPSRLHHGTSKREQAPPVPPNSMRGKYPNPETHLQIAPKMFASSTSEC